MPRFFVVESHALFSGDLPDIEILTGALFCLELFFRPILLLFLGVLVRMKNFVTTRFLFGTFVFIPRGDASLSGKLLFHNSAFRGRKFGNKLLLMESVLRIIVIDLVFASRLVARIFK